MGKKALRIGMFIQRLLIQNFRNLMHLELDPQPGFNLICGPNGAGKTSVLEAICYLAVGRSFRNASNQYLVQQGYSTFSLFAQMSELVQNQDVQTTIGMSRTRGEELLIKVNADPLERKIDLIDHICVQVLHPQGIELITKEAEGRRSFVDWGVYYQDPSFKQLWLEYRKALKQRNALLHQNSTRYKPRQRFLWDGTTRKVDVANLSYASSSNLAANSSSANALDVNSLATNSSSANASSGASLGTVSAVDSSDTALALASLSALDSSSTLAAPSALSSAAPADSSYAAASLSHATTKVNSVSVLELAAMQSLVQATNPSLMQASLHDAKPFAVSSSVPATGLSAVPASVSALGTISLTGVDLARESESVSENMVENSCAGETTCTFTGFTSTVSSESPVSTVSPASIINTTSSNEVSESIDSQMPSTQINVASFGLANDLAASPEQMGMGNSLEANALGSNTAFAPVFSEPNVTANEISSQATRQGEFLIGNGSVMGDAFNQSSIAASPIVPSSIAQSSVNQRPIEPSYFEPSSLNQSSIAPNLSMQSALASDFAQQRMAMANAQVGFTAYASQVADSSAANYADAMSFQSMPNAQSVHNRQGMQSLQGFNGGLNESSLEPSLNQSFAPNSAQQSMGQGSMPDVDSSCASNSAQWGVQGYQQQGVQSQAQVYDPSSMQEQVQGCVQWNPQDGVQGGKQGRAQGINPVNQSNHGIQGYQEGMKDYQAGRQSSQEVMQNCQAGGLNSQNILHQGSVQESNQVTTNGMPCFTKSNVAANGDVQPLNGFANGSVTQAQALMNQLPVQALAQAGQPSLVPIPALSIAQISPQFSNLESTQTAIQVPALAVNQTFNMVQAQSSAQAFTQEQEQLSASTQAPIQKQALSGSVQISLPVQMSDPVQISAPAQMSNPTQLSAQAVAPTKAQTTWQSQPTSQQPNHPMASKQDVSSEFNTKSATNFTANSAVNSATNSVDNGVANLKANSAINSALNRSVNRMWSSPLSEFSIWNEQLANLSEVINQKRLNYLKELQVVLQEILDQFLPDFKLKFELYFGWDKGSDLRAQLAQNLEKERGLGYTLYGCHRADLKIKNHNLAAGATLSRGQLKMLVYAMRLAQGMLLKQQNQRSCIYLIDDLNSELDENSQRRLLNTLLECQHQVFISNIQGDFRSTLIPHGRSDIKVFALDQGSLVNTMG